MPEGTICSACHVGTLHRRLATYTRWLESDLVIVPHTPALLCDACGELTFEAQEIRRLSALLGSEEDLADAEQQMGVNSLDLDPLTALAYRRRVGQ